MVSCCGGAWHGFYILLFAVAFPRYVHAAHFSSPLSSRESDISVAGANNASENSSVSSKESQNSTDSPKKATNSASEAGGSNASRNSSASSEGSVANSSRTPSFTDMVNSSGSYSTNAICTQNNCVNPIFPGYYDLDRLGALTWQCSALSQVKQYMSFCGDVVPYDPAIPSPSNTSRNLSDIVRERENAAASTYFFHLSALKYDPWSVRQGRDSNPCTEAIRRMACLTHFPQVQLGCKQGEKTSYLRPCTNHCENYMSTCNVRCCDESSRCEFDREVSLASGATERRTGYVQGKLRAGAGSRSCSGAYYSGARETGTFGSLLLVLTLSASLVGTNIR
eukprot:TRINITY_DN56730_c0_g1_i1.p1 TRINITY_DN56730_c0_g1~~TRINITY_DN56730_c0_g1_i1.p1  ORF type:complete len:337 (-),score=40.55 TRINITY_DN56730_c0_g1_i1:177-1187(-)